ncbi:MAG: response regulator [Polyangiaceae bacterium]
MAGDEEPKRVLLVDDEEPLVWSLSSRLSRARPHCVVDTAHDGEIALGKIQRDPYDLLVADVRMPGMSGTELILEARRLQPALPVIIMTAYRTADVQQFVTSSSTSFLEKPFEYDRFVQLVDESMSRPAIGFSGAISVQTLPDIVQLYSLSGATGLLQVEHRGEIGKIWFEQGAIVHATAGGVSGEDAFFDIMHWRAGEFSMRAGRTPTSRTIRASWHELLMESCRRVDEQRREDSGPQRLSGTGWTIVPPPSAATDELNWGSSFDEPPSSSSHEPIPAPLIPSIQDRTETSMNIKDSLTKLNSLDGFIGACLVDSESGMLLGQEGGGSVNLEVAAAGNTEVVRAKRKTMQNLNLKDAIEDILISLQRQYHIIRPLRARPTLFYYVALDRQRANLAMARIAIADVEKELNV